LDAAYAAWVMYHLADPQEVMAEAARVLRPGGRLLTLDRNRVDGGGDAWGELDAEIGRRLGRSRPLLTSGYERLGRLAESQGLRKLGIVTVCPWRDPRTLRQAIENTRHRVFGWDGTEDEWDRVIEPLLAAWSVRPDLDDVLIFEQGHQVLVLERP
jgi:SAM-dependent methyltransferase